MCVTLLTEEGERYFCEKKIVTSGFTGKKSNFDLFRRPFIKRNKKKFSIGFLYKISFLLPISKIKRIKLYLKTCIISFIVYQKKIYSCLKEMSIFSKLRFFLVLRPFTLLWGLALAFKTKREALLYDIFLPIRPVSVIQWWIR